MNPTTTIKIFGIYSTIMGLALLLFPQILPLLGLTVGPVEAWPRLLGFVLCGSSYYYIRSAFAGNIEFAKYTVHTRFMAPVAVILFILSGKADWHFLPFGIIDGLGGLWTYLAIKKYTNQHKHS
jgi:hypothetical protein